MDEVISERKRERERETLWIITFFGSLQQKDQAIVWEVGHILLPPGITPGQPRTKPLKTHSIVLWEGA